MTRSAPLLTTARLTLRAHRPADLDACAAMWGDAAVTRYILDHPATREETWARLLRYAGHWALLDFGYWLVEEAATGRLVGDVGFGDYQRTLEPSLDGQPEIGWALAAWAHRQGFATEAVGAVTAWSEVHLAGRATACIIDPDNAASLRIAARFHYREVAHTTYKGASVIVFRRDAAATVPR